jgi:hypothetical protein
MENERIWILFARRVSGEITPEELEELKALIRDQPDQNYSMEIVLRYFDADSKADEQDDADMAHRLWPRLEAAMHQPKITYSRPPAGDGGDRSPGDPGGHDPSDKGIEVRVKGLNISGEGQSLPFREIS